MTWKTQLSLLFGSKPSKIEGVVIVSSEGKVVVKGEAEVRIEEGETEEHVNPRVPDTLKPLKEVVMSIINTVRKRGHVQTGTIVQ